MYRSAAVPFSIPAVQRDVDLSRRGEVNMPRVIIRHVLASEYDVMDSGGQVVDRAGRRVERFIFSLHRLAVQVNCRLVGNGDEIDVYSWRSGRPESKSSRYQDGQ